MFASCISTILINFKQKKMEIIIWRTTKLSTTATTGLTLVPVRCVGLLVMSVFSEDVDPLEAPWLMGGRITISQRISPRLYVPFGNMQIKNRVRAILALFFVLHYWNGISLSIVSALYLAEQVGRSQVALAKTPV